MSTPALIGLTDAATQTGINRYALAKGVRDKSWPHHRVGARILFSQADLSAIIAATAVKPKPKDAMKRAAS